MARASGAIPSGSRSVRIGDRERNDVQSVLGEALAMGYLSMAEFQARSDLTLTATTSAELADVVADLPSEELRRNDPTHRAIRAARARRGVVAHAAAYAVAVLVMIVIWLVVAIPTGAWYPWPIWPLLGGGIGVLSHAVPAYAATRR